MNEEERYHWIIELSRAAQNTASTNPVLSDQLEKEALRLLAALK
jgi:hypothetical protein